LSYDSSGQTKREWNFTIERDIPIMAYTEEEAEEVFHKRYGNIPILGIIRPYRFNNSHMTVKESSELNIGESDNE